MTGLKWSIFFVVLYFGSEKFVESYPLDFVDDYIENFKSQLDQLKHNLNVSSKVEIREESKSWPWTTTLTNADFIVIGGGASGSVIASRLSEVPEWKVLLIEAGDMETMATKVPSMHSFLKSPSSNLTWGYYSTPQNHSCLDMEERRCYIPTPKIFGGTTAINDMLYTRGNPRDYDLWADMDLKGWSSASLQPYFKKIEDASGLPEGEIDRKSRHYGGPVHLEIPRYLPDITLQLLPAGREIGLKLIDMNGKESLGLGFPQLMTKDGQRFSAAEAYLKSTQHRRNLLVQPLSQVTRIKFGEHTKEASRVEFFHDNHLFHVSTNKEIILAGGAINSAKLLLLSGIGPEEHLKSLNTEPLNLKVGQNLMDYITLKSQQIEPIMNLKVGQNLMDHIIFPGLTYIYNQSSNLVLPFMEKELAYLRFGRGALASTGISLIGLIKTEYSKGRHLYPDVELLITSNDVGELPVTFDVSYMNYGHEEKPEIPQRSFTINIVLLHPKSRGTLELEDSDPHHKPLINLNSLSDANDDDIETMLSAVRAAQKLMDSEHIRKLNVHLQDNQTPHCNEYYFNSDNYWRCAIRHLSASMGHVTGSAPMGNAKNDHYGDSVVDAKLRVHGVDKLRVCDDSVVPVSISGHLAALKMVIGEKCAELLKEEWLK